MASTPIGPQSDTPCNINVDAKFVLATERLEKRLAVRERRRCERRCFWTRPRGHKYKPVDGLHSACVGCGKTIWSGD